MRNDVVEHLATIDIFEEHVPVIIGADNITHATDVRMVDQGDNGSLSCCADFFGVVCSFSVLSGAVLVG